MEFLAPDEPVEQLGDERVEAVGADAAAGLPQDLGHRGHVGPVLPGPASPGRDRGGPGRAAQQPDGGLAMDARHGDDLVQELAFSEATGLLVPLPLDGGVSRKLARSRCPPRTDW